MITCVIQYTLDPHAIEDFEKYATTWPPIIKRCGGELTGYYLPKEGANDWGDRADRLRVATGNEQGLRAVPGPAVR